MLLTPDSQLSKDRAQVAAGCGEHVLVPGRPQVVAAPFDEASVLEFAKPRRQAGPGCPGDGLDVVEAGHPEAQLPDGEQGPPVTNDLQRVGDRAHPPPVRFKL